MKQFSQNTLILQSIQMI